MSDVTRLLDAAAAGNPRAAADLLPVVYDELRRLAAHRLAGEKAGQTLQPTALVHEAYLRPVGDQQFDHRAHFFAAAAEAMRRILVEKARRKKRLRLGGGQLADPHFRHSNSVDSRCQLGTRREFRENPADSPKKLLRTPPGTFSMF